MGKHLVFVGGGHAHLTAMVNLADFVAKGHKVTLVNPIVRHYYSGMGPGMLSGLYQPHEIRFNVKKLVEDRGAAFIQAKVVGVEPNDRILTLDSGETLPYDVASFNTGSTVPLDFVKGSGDKIYPVKPIIRLLQARKAILNAIQGGAVPRLVIVGGGAAGTELTGNIHRLVHENGGQAEITLVAGKQLLPGLPAKARNLALASFERRGIEVREGARVSEIDDERILFSDESTMPYDLAFPAIGVKAAAMFKECGLATGNDGSLLVNKYLQSVSHPELFGGGDCISVEGHTIDRVGVYAVRQNPILLANLTAALEDGPMQEFVPQSVYMLIFNMGDGTGIFVRRSWVWSGTLAFRLKDYIDRKFMRSFQVSGEGDDTTVYDE